MSNSHKNKQKTAAEALIYQAYLYDRNYSASCWNFLGPQFYAMFKIHSKSGKKFLFED